MEAELIWSDPPEPWTPWDDAEYQQWAIETGRLTPPNDETALIS